MESNVSGYLRYTNMYTWVIENYESLMYNTSGIVNIDIRSPLITLYNRENGYEFQLKLKIVLLPWLAHVTHLSMSVETLSCPDDQTKAIIRLWIVKNNGDQLDPQEQISCIAKGKACFSHNIHYHKVIESCLSDGNLTVQFKITFCNDISHESNNAVQLGTTTALTSNKTSILDEYEELLNSAKFSDVTLVVGDKKFRAHKNILSTRSPVFSAMFEHDMLENKKNIVEIADVKPEIMVEILRFIYAGKVNNIEELSADLLAAADKYQLEALRLMCEEIFVKNLNIGNVVEMLKIVDRYSSCRRLRESVLKFLASNGREVASFENFDKIFEALSPALLTEVTKTILMKL